MVACRVVGLMQDWEISALGVCGPERLGSGLSPTSNNRRWTYGVIYG